MKANKARAMKTVPGKDTGYDDPEDGNNKETVASSKAVNVGVYIVMVCRWTDHFLVRSAS